MSPHYAAVGAGRAIAVPIPLKGSGGRKVRAPQGRVPGSAWGARAHGKCHRKYTAPVFETETGGKGEMVR